MPVCYETETVKKFRQMFSTFLECSDRESFIESDEKETIFPHGKAIMLKFKNPSTRVFSFRIACTEAERTTT